MKRWWIWLAAAVVGVVLAVLLIPSPDTGGDLAERPERLPRIEPEEAAAPADEDWHPVRTRPGLEPRPEPETRPDRTPPDGPVGNPISTALEEARQEPEVRALLRTTSTWTQVKRLLHGHDEDPLIPPLIDQTAQLVRDLRQDAMDPYTLEYAEYDRRMRELVGLLRQTSAAPDLERPLSRIEDMLDAEQLRQSQEAE